MQGLRNRQVETTTHLGRLNPLPSGLTKRKIGFFFFFFFFFQKKKTLKINQRAIHMIYESSSREHLFEW